MKYLRLFRRILRRFVPLNYRIKIATFISRSINFPKKPLLYFVDLPSRLENFVRNGISTKTKRNLLTGKFDKPIVEVVRNLLEARFRKNLKFYGRYNSDSYEPKPKKVMLVIGTLGGGGAERQLVLLAKSLRSQNWDPVVVVNHLDRPEHRTLMPLLVQDSIKVLDLDSFTYSKNQRYSDKSVIPIFDASFRLVEVIRSERPQVVHSWMDYANCETLLANQLIEIPKIVLGIRSVSPDSFPLWSPAFRPIYQRLAIGNISLVANSENGRRSYFKWLGNDEIDVIPNGVSYQFTTEDTRVLKINHNDTRNIIGCFRLSWEKGPDLWVEVAKLVCRENRDVCFHLFGDGPLRKNMEKEIAHSNLESKIVLHGFQANPWIELNWDLHLSTSRIEGMPNVVMEASAHHIPTIAFKVGGIPEVLGEDSELLVEPFDILSMVEKITSLLDSPERLNHQAKAVSERVAVALSVESMTSRYISIYEQ